MDKKFTCGDFGKKSCCKNRRKMVLYKCNTNQNAALAGATFWSNTRLGKHFQDESYECHHLDKYHFLGFESKKEMEFQGNHLLVFSWAGATADCTRCSYDSIKMRKMDKKSCCKNRCKMVLYKCDTNQNAALAGATFWSNTRLGEHFQDESYECYHLEKYLSFDLEVEKEKEFQGNHLLVFSWAGAIAVAPAVLMIA